MAQDDDLALVTGCCVIKDPNALGGESKFDGFTEKACKDAAEQFGLPWSFYPGVRCT